MSIFLQDWWLDIVYCNDWNYLSVEENQQLIAVLPYYVKHKFGFRTIMPPPLSPVNGFWIAYPQNIGRIKRISLENQVMNDFAKQLENMRLAFYSHQYSFHFQNWLGYYWQGFTQMSKVAYHIDLTQDWDSIEADIHNKTRRVIRTAKENLTVKFNAIDAKTFWDINSKSFSRQNLKVPYPYGIFEHLFNELRSRNKALAISIENSQGQIIACLLAVLNAGVCDALVAGTDTDLRSTNATTLAYYEAIRYAKENSCTLFNFNGSMLQSVETFYRHFGGIQTPYNLIEKRYSTLYSHLRHLKHGV
ncbi:MAG: GNAT family N-acetyltransferase [Bacteroidales bacterium]|nr:GNAT family N-acetyltransferase [Bacteroidales bacterium]